jgi:quercetin dioxygenase-like cupin family protein
MELFNLKNFIGGWFIGNFEPSIIKTKKFEVAIKYYLSTDKEPRHLHKLSQEITIVVMGKIKMNSKTYCAGDIIVIEKNESTDFECIEDAITCVVKTPSSINDKYFV